MPKLYASHTARHCVVKLEKDARFNVAAVAKDKDGSWALSITGRTGFPLVQAKFHDWGGCLGRGPHIPTHDPRNGIGYWRGESGFNSEQAALDELLRVLGPSYHF